MDHHEYFTGPSLSVPPQLPPLAAPGRVTTFYAYEGGAARNALLVALAQQLAGRDAAAPVLVVDWDLDAPALHRHFDSSGAQDGVQYEEGAGAAGGGLLALLESCRTTLRQDGRRPGESDEDLAERVLDGAGWQALVARVDGRRPLYLMPAGCVDDSFAGRVARLDLEALFSACPALYRRLGARLAARFGHVLVASRGGRSAAVSVCSALLADRLVGLFTPAPGSLDELEGVVRRAIDYRCSHEDEQRPLLFYPLACSADSGRSDPQGRWRRGDAGAGIPGYQPRLENLLRSCYDWPRVNLDSWFDETQLALADVVSGAAPATGGDRRALARLAAVLGAWVGGNHLPWQSLDEVRLRDRIAAARAQVGQATAPAPDAPGALTHVEAHPTPRADAHARADAGANTDAHADAHADALADALARLGSLYRRERRRGEASAAFEECLALRVSSRGDAHPATRAVRAALAGALRDGGKLQDARAHYALLVQACLGQAGADAPETLAARSGLARTLACMGEHERALALHEQVVAAGERALGDDHPTTLDCLEDLARSLVLQQDYARARILLERALAGRRQRQGSEHGDTLRCGQQLAQLLGATGELGNARRMIESVLRAHERHDGLDAAGTQSAREALAEILAAQGDLAAVRSIQASLAHARERQPGATHSEALGMSPGLGSRSGLQGEAERARRA